MKVCGAEERPESLFMMDRIEEMLRDGCLFPDIFEVELMGEDYAAVFDIGMHAIGLKKEDKEGS